MLYYKVKVAECLSVRPSARSLNSQRSLDTGACTCTCTCTDHSDTFTGTGELVPACKHDPFTATGEQLVQVNTCTGTPVQVQEHL
jgi:hypothetical protein